MPDMLKSQEAAIPYLNDEDMDLAEDAVMFSGPPPRAPMPPQRVRFATVATLSFDGYEETFEVSILNLSDTGLACTGPQGMAVGDRLRLRFRLHLAETAESFPCEVVWVHEPQATQTDEVGDDDEANYGMRFTGLDADLGARVQAVVRERAEGRASEWTLPVMPAAVSSVGEDFVLSAAADAELAREDAAGDFFYQAREQTAKVPPDSATASVWVTAGRRTETWVAAGAGLVVGLGLALALVGLMPASHAVKPVPVDEATQKTIEAAAAAAPDRQAAEAIPAAALAPPQAGMTAASGRGPTMEAATARTQVEARRVAVPVPSPASPFVALSAAKKPLREAAVRSGQERTEPVPLVAQRVRELAASTASAAKPGHIKVNPAPAAGGTGENPRIEGTNDRATLVLFTNGPVKDPHVFWMADPRRLVVDVPGRQSAAEGALFDLDHPMVSRVRVGKHADKVRFVVETGKDVMTQFATQVQGSTVRVALRRP